MKVTLGHQIAYKIIFAGAFGVGKTTALQNISESPIQLGDAMSLEVDETMKEAGKYTTTVGYDYGEIQLPDGMVVSLIGLPGQKRFEALWQVLFQSHTGVVLWLYGDKPDALNECKLWLDLLKKYNATKRLVLVLTRVPIPTPDNVLQPFRELLKAYNPYAPVMSGDPRDPKHVMNAVLATIATPNSNETTQ